MSYNLKNDVIFKAFFSKKGNEKFLKKLLELILEVKIEQIEVEKDASLDKNDYKGKLGVLDIKAKINQEKVINVEMQIENEKNIEKRTLFYGAKLIGARNTERRGI